MTTIRDIFAERIRREAVRRRARSDFLSFVQFTKPNYEVNWHHEALASKLEWWMETPGAKLIVCMPPRHGKSELVSRRLPAYILGRYPDSAIIACSYGQDLANAMSRDVQTIMDSPEYLSLFLASRRPFRDGTRRRTAVNEWQLAYRDGTYKAAGVGTGITGRGFDFGLIDDPFKDDADAQSARMRERVWYWYHSTFRTRRQPGARELITMTRWHQADVVGQLLHKEEGRWETLILPAVKEEGETIPEDPRSVGEFLWPSRFGPEQVEEVKAIPRVWNAAYRQSPSEGEGNVFKRSLFGYYDHLPADGFAEYVLSVDAAFKDNPGKTSRVSMTLWGRTASPPSYYLLDEETDHMGFLETLARARAILERWPDIYGRVVILVEDKANGPAIIEAIRQVLPTVVETTPKESKYARAQAVLPVFKSGAVLVPADDYLVRGQYSSRWVSDYIDELCEFPYHAFEDRVDSTSQVLLYFIENNWELNLGLASEPTDDDGELLFGDGDSRSNGKFKWTNPFSRR